MIIEGSGSRRTKNIRIRIRNTEGEGTFSTLNFLQGNPRPPLPPEKKIHLEFNSLTPLTMSKSRPCICNKYIPHILENQCSVSGTFGADQDPRIRTSDSRIRILLFLLLTFKIDPNKKYFFSFMLRFFKDKKSERLF